MKMGSWTVVGKLEYRGHEPGTTFDAHIPDGPASRAIARGAIRFNGWVEPGLPANHDLPRGWEPVEGGR